MKKIEKYNYSILWGERLELGKNDMHQINSVFMEI